jgi:hypothetical protein
MVMICLFVFPVETKPIFPLSIPPVANIMRERGLWRVSHLLALFSSSNATVSQLEIPHDFANKLGLLNPKVYHMSWDNREAEKAWLILI